MLTPDRAVDELWRRTITAPATWGRYADDGTHPMVKGSARAAGVLLVPVGFAVFVVALVLVIAPLAICYDVATAALSPVTGSDARARRR